jgi:hypothetical protein
MPQMFDWIFFAIILPVPILLVWDWYRQGNGSLLKAVQGGGYGATSVHRDRPMQGDPRSGENSSPHQTSNSNAI